MTINTTQSLLNRKYEMMMNIYNMTAKQDQLYSLVFLMA